MKSKYLELFDNFCAVRVDKDVEKVMTLFTNDAEVREPGVDLRVKNAPREFVARGASKYEDYVVEKLNVFEKEDRIAIEWRNRFKYERKSNDVLGVTVIRVRDGKIRRMNEYACTL